MAAGLDANRLGDAMRAAVDAVGVAPDIATYRTALFRALALAIVTEIKTNAVASVTSVSGVTTGAGVSGPGIGSVA